MRIFAAGKGRQIWIALGLVIMATIWIVSLIPAPPRVPGGDKLHHFAAYALVAFWWCALTGTIRAKLSWMLGLAAMGVLIEMLQGASGYRKFELADIVANSLGVICGGVLATVIPMQSINAGSRS